MNKTKQSELEGAMCGGVVNQTLFESDPMAYMMAYILPDDKFSAYMLAKKTGNDKLAKQIFDNHAWSAI